MRTLEIISCWIRAIGLTDAQEYSAIRNIRRSAVDLLYEQFILCTRRHSQMHSEDAYLERLCSVAAGRLLLNSA